MDREPRREPVIRATVNAVNRFGEVGRTVDDLARRATQAAAEEAARVARTEGSDRGLTDIEVVPVHGTENGYASGISGRWYYRFQSYGTLGRALNPKRPGTKRSHEPGTGIAPNRMFQRARTAGRKRLREVIFR